MIRDIWEQFIYVLGKIFIIPELKKQIKKLRYELDYQQRKNVILEDNIKSLENTISQIKEEKARKEDEILNEIVKEYDYVILSKREIYGTTFYRNGKEVEFIKNVNFEHELGSYPQVKLEV